MAAATPTLTWAQYQQLPPDQRRRPLTASEYASLTPSQLQAAGLADQGEGAPANFGGPVFPNPNHVQPQLDTDSAIPATRLPNGVSFQKGNYQGGAQPDVSNPATADISPQAGRTIGADMSAQPTPRPSGTTVPMIFDGDSSGQARDIPFEQMRDAMQNGGKLGVYVKFKDDPSGKNRVVPSDQVKDAVQNGGTIVPIEDQAVQHPGFWASMGADLGGMAKGLWHGATDPLTDTHEDLVRKLHEEQASDAAAQNSPERQAHGSLYRNVTVPLAQAVGVNVPGMEQSAAEGDVAGVYGHAAAPIAAAAVAKGVEGTTGALSEAADTAAGQGAKAGLKAAAKKLPVAMVRRIPYVGDVAADVYKAASDAASDAGSERPPSAPGYERYAPNTAAPAQPGPDQAPPAPAPAAQAQPAPAAAPPAAAPKANPAVLEQQLNDALGGKPLQPGVSLRNQASAPKATLPEGFTPVESSSLLKGYKYSPDTQEFDAVLQNGQRFRHGEVTPEQFQAFEETDSKGKAWNDLRDAPGVTPLGKVNAGGTLQPRIKPRTIVVDPETGSREFSDVVASKSQPAPQAKAAAAGAGNEDQTSLWQKSLDQVNAGKAAASSIPEEIPQGGVFTTAAPADLTKRWGVTGNSVADTDANLRGMNLKQSQDYVNQLAESYKNGKSVEPVLETRDVNNNITSVDGRHRVLAAQKAGIERIPIVVRRLGSQ
jgi:hypothetical protein